MKKNNSRISIRFGRYCLIFVFLLLLSKISFGQSSVHDWLGDGKKMALYAGTEIISASNLAISNGYVASEGPIGFSVIAPKHLVLSNGDCQSSSLLSNITVPSQFKDLAEEMQLPVLGNPELGDAFETIVEGGILENDVVFDSRLTLTGDGIAVRYIYVAGDLYIGSSAEMVLDGVKPENVIIYVAGNVTIEPNANLQGIIVSNQSIFVNGVFSGKTALLAGQGIELLQDNENYNFYSQEYLRGNGKHLLKNAASYALLGENIYTDEEIVVNEKAGANGLIDGPISAPANQVYSGGSFGEVGLALTDLGEAINELNCLSGTSLSTLNGQNLLPGVFSINGGNLNGALTLQGDSNSIYIINIESDFEFSSGSIINVGQVRPENIYWNIAGQLEIQDRAVFSGLVLCQGPIYKHGINYGEATFLSLGDITLESLKEDIGHNNFFAPLNFPQSTALPTPPTIKYTATDNSIKIIWEGGSGDKLLVLMKDAPFKGMPEAGKYYFDNPKYKDGFGFSDGSFVVYNSNLKKGETIITGLEPLTMYRFEVYSYNGYGSSIIYSDSSSVKIATTDVKFSVKSQGCFIASNSNSFSTTTGNAPNNRGTANSSPCNDIPGFLPKPTDPVKTIRLVFHVFQDDHGNGNWSSNDIVKENELKGLIDGFNYLGKPDRAGNKPTLHFPGLNDVFSNIPTHTPPVSGSHIQDSRIRFQLEGVFYHQDENAWNQNSQNPDKIENDQFFKKFVTNNSDPNLTQDLKDNALHIYFGEVPPMPWQVPGPITDPDNALCTYIGTPGRVNIGGSANYLGRQIFTHGYYWGMYSHPYIATDGDCNNTTNGERGQYILWNLAHEIGHVLDLPHIFYDGPNGVSNTECSVTADPPQVHSETTNNIMDYVGDAKAFTACQISIMHRSLVGANSNPAAKDISSTVVADFCTHEPLQSTIISSSETWYAPKIIKGNLFINSGATLTIKCRVSFAGPQTKIIISHGGKLVLDGGSLGSASNMNCQNPVTVNIGEPNGNSNNPGMFEVIGAGVIIHPNVSLKLLPHNSMSIGSSAQVLFYGSLTTEPGSYICINPSALLTYRQTGYLDINPLSNKYINSTVSPRPTACLPGNNCSLVPTISGSNGGNALCFGNEVTLYAQYGRPGVTYTWFKGSQQINGPSTNTITVKPFSNAEYSVEINDIACNRVIRSEAYKVTVNPLPIVSAGGNFLANPNATDIMLDQLNGLSPSGGYWSGKFVSYKHGIGYSFSPRAAAMATPRINTVVLTYTVGNGTGCTNSQSITVTIDPNITVVAPTVYAGADQIVCPDDSKFNLNSIAGLSPRWGFWSGVDQNNKRAPIDMNGWLSLNASRIMSPNASITYYLTYTIFDYDGTPHSDTVALTLYGRDNFTGSIVPLADRCVNGGPITLPLANVNSSMKPVMWSGSAGIVQNGNTAPGASKFDFNPALAGPGIHTLYYSYINPVTGCTLKGSGVRISVYPDLTTTINAGPDETVCKSAGAIKLTGNFPTPGVFDDLIINGTWSGPGVTATGLFDPSTLNAGNHTLTYTVPNSCGSFSDTRVISVTSGGLVDAGFDREYCVKDVTGTVNQNLIQLAGTPTGGTWAVQSGNATVTSAGLFDISNLSTGEYTLRYTNPDPNLCKNFDDVKIKVKATNLAVSMKQNFTSCDNPYVLNHKGNGAGESWSGPGITYDPATGEYLFDPTKLAPGKAYTLKYTAYIETIAGSIANACYRTIPVTVNVACCVYANIYQKTGGNYINPIAGAPDYEIGTATNVTIIDAANFLNNTVVFEGNYHVKGHVLLTSSQGTGTFRLKPGTKFIVDAAAGNIPLCGIGTPNLTRIIVDYAKLELDGAILQAVCEDMWGGIWLRDGADLLAVNAVIQDAETGVLVQGCTGPTTMSPYEIYNTRFRNNGTGVAVYNMDNGQFGQGYGLRSSTFEMDWTSTLKLPGLSKFTNEGVHMEGNIITSNDYGQFPVVENTFLNLGIGVNSFLAPNALISKNTFRENWVTDISAIGLENAPCVVDRNVIEVSRKPGPSETPYLANHVHTGIEAEEGVVITGNTLTKTSSGATSPNDAGWRGIGITNRHFHGGHAVKVEKDNIIKGFTEGVRIEMQKQGTAGGYYVPPVVLGNSFENNAIGVKVVESTGTANGTEIAPTLHISCNTFTQTGSPAQDVYGIYGDEGAMFRIDRPAPNSGATMRNHFTGAPGKFIHLYNHTSNPLLTYTAYRTGSGNSQTPSNFITSFGNLFVDMTTGLTYDPQNNCLYDGYSNGIRTRVAKPGNNYNVSLTKPVVGQNQEYLEQNYPNPFSHETNIRYALPEDKGNGELLIRDMITGKVVMRQELKGKSGTAVVRTGSLKAGMYIYTLEVDGIQVASKKMIILQR